MEKSTANAAESKTLADGSVQHTLKCGRKALAKNDSDSSTGDCDWINTLQTSGAQGSAKPANGRAKANAKQSVAAADSPKVKKTHLNQGGDTPKRSANSSSSGGVLGSGVFKSVQLREINSTRQVMAKYQHLITSLANEEGLKSLTVDKALAAANMLANKLCLRTSRN